MEENPRESRKASNLSVDSSDERLFNLLTHALVPENIEHKTLQRDNIGQKSNENFVVRMNKVTKSVWDEMKKRKIGSSKQTNRSTKIKYKNGKIHFLKVDRNLLQRFTIITRKRSNLDLVVCIGQYEVGVVSCASFSADGTLLLEKKEI